MTDPSDKRVVVGGLVAAMAALALPQEGDYLEFRLRNGPPLIDLEQFKADLGAARPVSMRKTSKTRHAKRDEARRRAKNSRRRNRR